MNFSVIFYFNLFGQFGILKMFNMLNGSYMLFCWGLGIGDWGLGFGRNPQSPIPNLQSPINSIMNLKEKYNLYQILYNIETNYDYYSYLYFAYSEKVSYAPGPGAKRKNFKQKCTNKII